MLRVVAHYYFFFFFLIKPQGLCEKVELWEDCYGADVNVCTLQLTFMLFTQQIRGYVWAKEIDGLMFGDGERAGIMLSKPVFRLPNSLTHFL